MGQLLAAWRISLRRTRADWPIVAAAALITLLATVLLAAGPMYASAAAEAGLRRSLGEADPRDTNVLVSLYARIGDVAAVDAAVIDELAPVVASVGRTIIRDWRSTTTLVLPELRGSAPGDRAVMGSLDELETRAALRDGAWPVDRSAPGDPVQVVVLDRVADELGLAVGDDLALVAHPTEPVEVRVRVVGVFVLEGAETAYWQADEQLLTGRQDIPPSRTFGPFLTTPADLVGGTASDSLRMQWITLANFTTLTADETPAMQRALSGLEERLTTAAGVPVQVMSGLPQRLGAAERSLLVTRTGVLLLMAQLGTLAAYAIVLTASLLVEHRRIDTALFRSRGANARAVAVLALCEGLLVAVPAVLVAPWLALGLLEGLNAVGPLAEAGLHIEPRISADAYLAAGVAGLVTVVLLALPALLAARGFAAEHGGLSRQQTETFGQRVGLDIALLTVTAVALWQLRVYGAPLTRTVQGSLGLDPLLVAAPAIGLLAGGVVALRLLPLLAMALESAISRGSGLVAALGARQLARRPLRYTRSALLLMLAVSMGVFAQSYATTWLDSQHDQAEYQVGADVRLVAGASTRVPPWVVAATVTHLPGLARVAAAERLPLGVTFRTRGAVALLALDAESAGGIVRQRDDGDPGIAGLFEQLRAGRPEQTLVPIAEGAAYVRVAPWFDPSTARSLVEDPETGELEPGPAVDPADIEARASILLVDPNGVIVTAESAIVSADAWADGLVIPIAPGAAAPSAGGWRLLQLSLELWLPGSTIADAGTVGVTAAWTGSAPDGPWDVVALDTSDRWAAMLARGRSVPERVPDDRVDGTSIALDGQSSTGFIGGARRVGAETRLTFLPAAIDDWESPVPVLANRAFAVGDASQVGDSLFASVAGQSRRLEIVGIVDEFPTTDPAEPLVVMDQPTLALIRVQGGGAVAPPSEWWLAAAPGQAEQLAAAAGDASIGARQVLGVEARARALSSDPVALGIVGALSLGALATGAFAVVGLSVSTAVSARQRRTEFALLRALGLSRRQLSGTLWLENASLAVVSLFAGTSLGLLIAWLVLPYVTVTQGGATPIPPVVVHIPWGQIALLNAVGALTLGLAVVAIARLLRSLGMGSVLRMGED